MMTSKEFTVDKKFLDSSVTKIDELVKTGAIEEELDRSLKKMNLSKENHGYVEGEFRDWCRVGLGYCKKYQYELNNSEKVLCNLILNLDFGGSGG